MSRKNRIVEALRSATGSNDNVPSPGGHIVFNGPVNIYVMSPADGQRPAPQKREPVGHVPLNTQNLMPRNALRSRLDLVPPLSSPTGGTMDPAVGSARDTVSRRPYFTSAAVIEKLFRDA